MYWLPGLELNRSASGRFGSLLIDRCAKYPQKYRYDVSVVMIRPDGRCAGLASVPPPRYRARKHWSRTSPSMNLGHGWCAARALEERSLPGEIAAAAGAAAPLACCTPPSDVARTLPPEMGVNPTVPASA